MWETIKHNWLHAIEIGEKVESYSLVWTLAGTAFAAFQRRNLEESEDRLIISFEK